ncbi:hypothetical protein V1503_24950 [Bacillus sp. SCS-151]|uniref:hypothetical protein n=1 Tax=Nanhaiella sioensis TaxID=3115293 RepID=UPI003979435E
MSVYNEKRKLEEEEKITFAYLSAHWQRVKKLPSFKQVLGKQQQQPQKMTPEQMLAKVKQLNAALGGETNSSS